MNFSALIVKLVVIFAFTPAKLNAKPSTEIPTPAAKHTHTDAFVVFFQYKPNKNGAKNAPEIAPQEIPINEAISFFKLAGTPSVLVRIAIPALIAMNITTNTLNQVIFFFSLQFFFLSIKSNVTVALDV